MKILFKKFLFNKKNTYVCNKFKLDITEGIYKWYIFFG